MTVCAYCGKGFDFIGEPPLMSDFCLVQEVVHYSPVWRSLNHLSHTGVCADKLTASFRVNRALKDSA